VSPTRVETDLEPKENLERTAVSANAPRLCNRRPSLGPDPSEKEAIEC
jgi:hypothetical protein